PIGAVIVHSAEGAVESLLGPFSCTILTCAGAPIQITVSFALLRSQTIEIACESKAEKQQCPGP
ncbi:hypothetical protein ACC734_40450, partial [Rhizobium ruizarguesonis]